MEVVHNRYAELSRRRQFGNEPDVAGATGLKVQYVVGEVKSS